MIDIKDMDDHVVKSISILELTTYKKTMYHV
jgi:hypothetical protein